MKRILVADDNKDFLGIMKPTLEERGYMVKTVNGKRDLLTALKSFNPDVLLLDVFLDKFDGRQICKEIHESSVLKHVPTIIFSANPYSLSHFDTYGAVDYIEKPIVVNQLIEKIEKMLLLEIPSH